ncbi:MAG: hypothetical protein FWG33_02090, partial [Oscillospiraceae bacterium]|nr:hypothetical protein [Oscillospiraceae bacterium]
MKKLKTIFGLSLSIFMFCSCVSNEVSPNTGGAREPDKIIEREESYVDDVRRASGFTDEEALELMLMEDCCHTTRIGSSNIILGIPTEITFGEDLKGRLAGDWGEIIFVDYLFKITDNLTGNSLPEYITVSSQIGDIFELGKEYCINPSHNNSTL